MNFHEILANGPSDRLVMSAKNGDIEGCYRAIFDYADLSHKDEVSRATACSRPAVSVSLLLQSWRSRSSKIPFLGVVAMLLPLTSSCVLTVCC